ncbi:hypothetical protein Ccrd_022581 [Cynara cardunculus var. scolymus]|uniref:Uncharacterized protein n=1 Tax=Cynara cardunculus var. scolymus TaxID=59895 RepID=A0A118JZB5_CYNCS|nr:hypothetical protein Ccrd_022581 [Cynara cardunculus var. scolymus]
MGGGTFLLHFLERMDYINVFFRITSTNTSIDSDGCFITKCGRVFSVFWMVNGTIFIGHLLLPFMELNIQERQMSFVKLVLERKMTRADFKAVDIVTPKTYIPQREKIVANISARGSSSGERSPYPTEVIITKAK